MRARHAGFGAIEQFPAGGRTGVRANLEQAFLFPAT